jgi:hypothetical protein
MQKLQMLQNAVGDVAALSYVKQLGDQDIARGLPSLPFGSYLELLLSACSTYDKNIGTHGNQKQAVYAALMEDTDPDPLPEDKLGGEYEVFMVDTDTNDIKAYNSNMNRMGPARNDSEMKTKYLPREERIKLSQAQKDTLLEKRRKERSGGNNRSINPNTRQVNAHHMEDLINLDDLIDYTIMSHKIDSTDVGNDPKNSDDLLAFMAGTKSDAGDICKVLAAKQASEKNKNRKAREAASVPSSIQVGDHTYYLNKNDIKYTTNMPLSLHRVGKHHIAQADKALVDRGANGGIVGDDMIIV